MRKLLTVVVASTLLLTALTTPAQAATPKAGAACAKAGITQVVKAGTKTTKFTCVKSGSKLTWNKGVVTIAKPTTPTPEPTKPSEALSPATKASLTSWNSPPIYDLRLNKKLSFNFTLETNGKIDDPEVTANFFEPNKTSEVPAQSISIKATVIPQASSGLRKTYSVELSIDDRQALGNWLWHISPITANGKEIARAGLTESQAKFEFRRDVFGTAVAVPIAPGALFAYQSFKGQSSQLYPWEGKNLVLLTKTNTLAPAIMGRIVSTLDKVFESYRSITQYSPAPYRTYNGKLSIAVLPSTEIGCGAACGFLGATGIEIGQPLFNRLYNGVELFDQYDQALFYELGRNFWDYAGLHRVLTKGGSGTWDTDPFWDAATTGFAVYMRAVTAEINNVPMQPWDGNNSSWNAFLAEIKALAYEQRESADKNFFNTFQSKKSPSAGPLGVTDFWASVMFYFAEGKDLQSFTRTFFESLKKQRTPNSTAQVVENFVNSLSAAAGQDVSEVFYKTLRFKDAQNLP